MQLLYLLTKPIKEVEDNMNKAMETKNMSVVAKEYNNFVIKMSLRYIIFNSIFTSYTLFSFYYLIAFSGVYPNSSLGWISGGFITFFLFMFGFDLILPIFAAILKKVAKSYPFYR